MPFRTLLNTSHANSRPGKNPPNATSRDHEHLQRRAERDRRRAPWTSRCAPPATHGGRWEAPGMGNSSSERSDARSAARSAILLGTRGRYERQQRGMATRNNYSRWWKICGIYAPVSYIQARGIYDSPTFWNCGHLIHSQSDPAKHADASRATRQVGWALHRCASITTSLTTGSHVLVYPSSCV